MTLFQSRSGSLFAEPPVPSYPGQQFGGITSSPAAAMTNDAVWACVRLLAESVSMMPLHAYTMRDGVRVRATTQPKLLTSPAPDMTTQEWVYMMMVSMLLRGNSFTKKLSFDRNGWPTQVYMLPPDGVTTSVDADGKVHYRIQGGEITPGDMMHVRAFPMPGRVEGLSPIRLAASRVLSTMQAAAIFGEDFLSAGGHPSSILSVEKPMTADQAKQAKQSFVASVRNREPALLSGGVTWSAVQINPEESQFLETQKYGASQIARIFGVPAEMIGAPADKSMTYANITQRSLDFLVYSVQPWLTRIEAAISAMLPGNQHVRFDSSELVRMDEQTKATVDELRLRTGSKVINEVRAGIDLPPVPWGNEPYLEAFATASAMTQKQADVGAIGDTQTPNEGEQE